MKRAPVARLRRRLRRWRRPEDGGGRFDFRRSLDDAERDLVDRALRHSLTSPERIVAVSDAVQYVLKRGIDGALVECGVWRGGSVLAMLLTLRRAGVDDRDVYLYDTFEGMTEPTDADTTRYEAAALDTWEQAKATGRTAWDWLFNEQFSLAGVQELLYGTGYPRDRLHFVAGRVEDTLPDRAPEHIALLRLDTDWYESTLHELVHLYPRLAKGGVLILDDYGHWEGARRAVDEYFSGSDSPLLLGRIDYTGRIAVKH